MQPSAIDILDLLMKGIHPITGEIFEDDHVCNEPMVIRALASAVIALRQSENTEPSGSDINHNGRLNAGRSWTKEDDTQLRDLFLQNTSIEDICKLLHRRNRGVMNRLAYLKLIPKTEEHIRPGLENAGAPWYDADDQLLREMFDQKLPIADIAAHFKRTHGAIRSRMVKLGLIENKWQYVDGFRPWTSKDTEFLRRLYEDGASIPSLAVRFGCTEAAVRARLFYMGVTKEAPNLFPGNDSIVDPHHQ